MHTILERSSQTETKNGSFRTAFNTAFTFMDDVPGVGDGSKSSILGLLLLLCSFCKRSNLRRRICLVVSVTGPTSSPKALSSRLNSSSEVEAIFRLSRHDLRRGRGGKEGGCITKNLTHGRVILNKRHAKHAEAMTFHKAFF